MALPEWGERLEEIDAVVGHVERAARLLDQLVGAVNANPIDDLGLTLAVSELRAETIEDPWWADSAFTAAEFCAGIRTQGPLLIGSDLAWSCAARAVTDLVNRMEVAVWQHAPFGEAVEQFNLVYDRLTRMEAIRTGQLTEAQAGDAVPPRLRARVYPLQPSRAAVLRSGWSGADRTVPGVSVPAEVWSAVDAILGVWQRGRRALDKVLAYQREHVTRMPFSRIREELAWEFARLVTDWELRGATLGGGREDGEVAERPVRRDGRLEARDQWIYQQVMDTDLTYNAIGRQLVRLAPARGWSIIRSVEGIRQRAIRYAETNGLPLPPARQQR